MNDLQSLPLEILEQIALFDSSIWYKLAIVIKEFGLYSIKDENRLRAKQHFTVCIVTDEKVEYRLCGKLHRDDGPASIRYGNGIVTYGLWYRDGKWHRDDGPAFVGYSNGIVIYEEWYKDDKRHRDDGPAVVKCSDGIVIYESWHRDGKLHRDGGPALIRYKNGLIIYEEWWRDNKQYTNVNIIIQT